MAVYAYPRILKDRYNSFRLILPELPGTFEKWEVEVAGKIAMDRLAKVVLEGDTLQSRGVLIDGGSFLAYCNEKNERPTVDMLYRYASERYG
jgi:hypothetical protein